MKISYRLTLATFSAALLILSVGSYVSVVSQKSLQQYIEADSAARSAEILDELERKVHQEALNWIAYSRMNHVQAWLEKANAAFEAIPNVEEEIDLRDTAWRAQSEKNPYPLSVTLLTNPLATELAHHIDSFDQGIEHSVYPEVFLTNRFGAVIAQTNPTSDYRQNDENWWEKAFTNGVFIGEVGFDESAQTRSLDICLRIADESGKVLGVMKVVYNIQNMIELLDARARLTSSAPPRIILLSENAQTIYDSTHELETLEDGSRYLEDRPPSPPGTVNQILRYDAESDRNFLSSLVRSEPDDLDGGLGWHLLLEHDAEELFLPLRKMKERILLGTFAATFLGLLLSVSFSRSILRPINALVGATRAIGRGDLKARAAIDSIDEFAILGASFNQMAADLDAAMQEEIERRDVLHKHSQQLEAEVRERKRVEKELIETSKLAQEAARAKSDFLANMSHEIRTPMNGIMGMSELLMDSDLAGEPHEFAKMIHSSATGLLSVINDILDFSKVEAGKLVLDPVRFDLYSLIEDSGRLFAERSRTSNLELVVRYAPNAPRFFIGDPGRIRQIVLNLMGNAVKFTHDGYILISVEVESRPQNQARIQVSVEDTGVGIPEEKLSSIFGKFEQADTSTTRKYGGTGLGLAISKQLVELMNGTIHVASTVGEGTVIDFEIDLPLGDRPRPIETDRVELEGLRILVVDDQLINRRVVAEQLQHCKVQCRVCDSGRLALDELTAAADRHEPYDIAILDYQMPEMDGKELIRRIKADPRHASIAVIVLSSCGNRGEATDLSRVGAMAYLSKPVGRDELIETIKTVWGRIQNGIDDAQLITRHTLRESREIDAPESGGKPAATPLDGRILLAEDNLVNQKLGIRLLERMGLKVDLAENGKQALEIYRSAPYDLIFMDCQMPEMDGYEATQEIRRREAGASHIPIIAMTARAMQGDRERCLASGMDDYLSKPIKAEDLRSMVERWLSAPPANPASESTEP
jgi:signal transduction histidine kinase/CheY-like chemotaxis protein